MVPSRISVVLVEETKAGDTSRPECPCDYQERQPLAGGAVSEGDTQSPCGGGGGGGLPSSGTAGRLLPVDVMKTPTLSVDRSPPQWVLQTLWAPMARLLQVAPLSPLFHDVLGPLEHSVPEETILGLDPLEHSGLDHAETILGLDPLEHSGLDHAVPVVRHFAGGPVGPDETLLGLDPLEHSGQYETFNGMTVYYGGDLYDSEDSDWDDPYALASAAYVEDYNFDVPEGMDFMVHRHNRFPENSDVRQDCDNDSFTMTADEDDPDMNDFYQRVVSSDDENYLDSDNGSVTDFDGSMSEGAYCVVFRRWVRGRPRCGHVGHCGL